jgi:6,7-dimethyl-8-ribityllumazine synthase
VSTVDDGPGASRAPYGVGQSDGDEPLPLIRTALSDDPPEEEAHEAPEAGPESSAIAEDAAVVDAPVSEPVAAPPEHAAGELRLPDGVMVYDGYADGARRTVGIVVSRYNGAITNRLLDGAIESLEEAGVARDRIDVMAVPGAFELPLGAMALAKTRRYSCIVALGCVIRGDTPHFDYVCSEAASGLQLAGLETGVPVSFGVLTCDTEEQAEERAGGAHGNKGAEAVRSALEMADVFARLRASA